MIKKIFANLQAFSTFFSKSPKRTAVLYAGATRCYERWLQRWTEHLKQIRSTVGATNVPATRCSECLIQKVWYKRLSGLSRVQP
jgi:hypothetical protein